MKLLLAIAIFCTPAGIFLGQSTTTTAASRNLKLTAEHMTRKGEIIQLRGHVQITTDAVVIHADKADFNSSTGELQPRGNVRLNLYGPGQPARPASEQPAASVAPAQ